MKIKNSYVGHPIIFVEVPYEELTALRAMLARFAQGTLVKNAETEAGIDRQLTLLDERINTAVTSL